MLYLFDLAPSRIRNTVYPLDKRCQKSVAEGKRVLHGFSPPKTHQHNCFSWPTYILMEIFFLMRALYAEKEMCTLFAGDPKNSCAVYVSYTLTLKESRYSNSFIYELIFCAIQVWAFLFLFSWNCHKFGSHGHQPVVVCPPLTFSNTYVSHSNTGLPLLLFLRGCHFKILFRHLCVGIRWACSYLEGFYFLRSLWRSRSVSCVVKFHHFLLCSVVKIGGTFSCNQVLLFRSYP